MGASNHPKRAKICTAIIWLWLFAFSAGSLIVSVRAVFSLPFDHSQLLNAASLIYNLFLLYGVLLFNERALALSQSLQSSKLLCLFLSILFLPILVTSLMSCGVFQSAHPIDVHVQSQVIRFVEDEIEKLPIIVKPIVSNTVAYLLRKVIQQKGPGANFNIGMEAGFIVEGIILFFYALYFIEYHMIGFVRNRIIDHYTNKAQEEETIVLA